MFKKWMMILSAVALLSSPAFAGNTPEFDAVGNDAFNFFNDAIKQTVVDNNEDRFGDLVNHFSDFTWAPVDPSKPTGEKMEFFVNTAGDVYPDPCFPGYLSSMVDMSNSASFTWQIVLQMKPESDIDLNIQDCVLKHNAFIYSSWPIFGWAEQTGRYRTDRGKLMFLVSANPAVTVKAFPGKFATAGFPATGFHLDARTMPNLDVVGLYGALYTSKALWEEGLVMVMPETGKTNAQGDKTYALKQGDRIRVTIDVPEDNTADIFYGDQNVILKYIGIVGTDFSTFSI